uniref:Uncharacterized protein n=1 Tax=Anguilla anguilla TaxID=7936 RepID=A0A0E9WXQ2_ANGAN
MLYIYLYIVLELMLFLSRVCMSTEGLVTFFLFIIDIHIIIELVCMPENLRVFNLGLLCYVLLTENNCCIQLIA